MAKASGRARNGFFFAVMALAMLSLVLMTVQVWVKTFEQSDYSASQRFKGEAMRSILATVSDKELSDFANASAFYATYKLANYTSDINNGGLAWNGTADTLNPNTGNVEKAAIELMTSGNSTPNSNSNILYGPDEMDAYTIEGWQNQTNAAASAMGFDMQFSGPKDFRYYQINPWTVGVSFSLEMNITDAEGTMRQQKELHASSNFSISGFLDPMITRDDMAHRPGIARGAATEKQIFTHDDYQVPQDVRPVLVDSEGKEGNGWFFGPIAEDYPSPNASVDSVSALDQDVLVHDYDENLPVYAGSYGAVIITSGAPTNVSGCVERQYNCLNCMERDIVAPGCTGGDTAWHTFPNNNPVNVPVIVAGNGWDISKVTEVSKAQDDGTMRTDRFVLVDNAYESPGDKKLDGYHRIWDMTPLRDMAICGFYVKGVGPSFFQRMLSGAQTISNHDLGIESFVVGQWAGGALDQSSDVNSRLDWEFYSNPQPFGNAKIKGMMGCKSKDMCDADNATKVGVGHFTLSTDAVSRYLADNVSCRATGQISPC